MSTPRLCTVPQDMTAMQRSLPQRSVRASVMHCAVEHGSHAAQSIPAQAPRFLLRFSRDVSWLPIVSSPEGGRRPR